MEDNDIILSTYYEKLTEVRHGYRFFNKTGD